LNLSFLFHPPSTPSPSPSFASPRVNPRITRRFNLARSLVSQVSFSGMSPYWILSGWSARGLRGCGIPLLERDLIYRRELGGNLRTGCSRPLRLDKGREQQERRQDFRLPPRPTLDNASWIRENMLNNLLERTR
jgi:hypothetical protein